MKRISPQGAVPLLFAAAMAASFAAATPARAQGFGDGGGEGGSWQYELYIEREAEALRKKKLAESQAKSGAQSQAESGAESQAESGAQSQAGRDARQKAGIGIQEFDARPIVSTPQRSVTTGLDDPEQHNRGN